MRNIEILAGGRVQHILRIHSSESIQGWGDEELADIYDRYYNQPLILDSMKWRYRELLRKESLFLLEVQKQEIAQDIIILPWYKALIYKWLTWLQKRQEQ